MVLQITVFAGLLYTLYSVSPTKCQSERNGNVIYDKYLVVLTSLYDYLAQNLKCILFQLALTQPNTAPHTPFLKEACRLAKECLTSRENDKYSAKSL